MSSLPAYVRRFARAPQVLAHLQSHPEGLWLSALAEHFEVKPDELRAELIAFFMADVGTDDTFLGLSDIAPLEFTNGEGEETDPNDATWVRVVDPRPTEELGVEYLNSSELGLVWLAGQSLAAVEPDNVALAEAIEVLRETLFEGADDVTVARAVLPEDRHLTDLRRAIEGQLLVEIEYSPAWQAGRKRRTIAPFIVVQTHRGWEVDAGAVESELALRTFLVQNIRELTVLEQTFARPTDLAERLAQARVTERVRLQVPHAARWAADMYAESVSVVADEDSSQTLDLELLPPAERRVGLILLAAGEESRVISPRHMLPDALQGVRELLAHHRREPDQYEGTV